MNDSKQLIKVEPSFSDVFKHGEDEVEKNSTQIFNRWGTPWMLVCKIAAFVFAWRVFNVPKRLKTMIRHPLWSIAAISVAVKGYFMMKKRMPYFRSKVMQKAQQLGIKMVMYGAKYAMSAMRRGNQESLKTVNHIEQLKEQSQIYLIPILAHVNVAVEKHIGSVKTAISEFKRDLSSMNQKQKSLRICFIFRKAVTIHVVTVYAIAYLKLLTTSTLYVSQIYYSLVFNCNLCVVANNC